MKWEQMQGDPLRISYLYFARTWKYNLTPLGSSLSFKNFQRIYGKSSDKSYAFYFPKHLLDRLSRWSIFCLPQTPVLRHGLRRVSARRGAFRPPHLVAREATEQRGSGGLPWAHLRGAGAVSRPPQAGSRVRCAASGEYCMIRCLAYSDLYYHSLILRFVQVQTHVLP